MDASRLQEAPHPVDEKWRQPRSEPEKSSFSLDIKDWNALGGAKLEPLLDHIDLIDLEYIIECVEADRRVPRWQDVPIGARINRGNAKRIEHVMSESSLPILVLSYPWMDPEHPDKQLASMRRLLPALKAFLQGAKRRGKGHTVGLMMDYPCLPQKHISGEDDRTEEEKQRFKNALGSINQWYQHPHTTVLIFDVDLPAPESGHANLRPYAQRGWCSFEFRASCLLKPRDCLWSLDGYERGGKHSGYLAALRGAAGGIYRAAPMQPDRFGKMLRDGVQTGRIVFTAKADIDVVIDQYRFAFTSTFKEARDLSYGYLGWPDEQAFELAEALAYAREQGSFQEAGTLSLKGNGFTDAGKDALRKAASGTGLHIDV